MIYFDCSNSLNCLLPSQPHLLGKWDLKDLFESVSLERAHGHNQNMSYHEYVAAVMHDRVDIKSSRLDLVFSFLDPDNTGYVHAIFFVRC